MSEGVLPMAAGEDSRHCSCKGHQTHQPGISMPGDLSSSRFPHASRRASVIGRRWAVRRLSRGCSAVGQMFVASLLPMLDTDPPGLNVFTMERMMKLPSTAHLARVCARHPWKVIGAWVVVVALALIAARGLDDALTTSADFSGKPEYQVGADLLQQRLRGDRPLTETVVVHSDSERYDDASFQSTVEQATTALTGMQEVTEVSNLYLAQAAQAPGASS